MATDESYLSLTEFDPPSPLTKYYVPQLTQFEYEDQSATETEKALMDLITHLERDPKRYARIVRQRKLEEQENGGFLAMLKVRLMSRLKGADYHHQLVTEGEVQNKLDDLKTGMMMAYNYAQETKGRRYSRRLALKKARERELAQNNENIPLPSAKVPAASDLTSSKVNGEPLLPPPPPPPPMPPPSLPLILTPLKDKNVVTSTPFQNPKRKLFRTGSVTSLSSVHSELVSTNPLKRLRATRLPRSPGGTPMCRRPIHGSNKDLDQLNQSESLSSAFFRVMEAKFRNVRSPSPNMARNVTVTSPSDFSP